MRSVRVGFRVEMMESSVGVSNQEVSLTLERRVSLTQKYINSYTDAELLSQSLQVTTSHQTSMQHHTQASVSEPLSSQARAQSHPYQSLGLVAIH